MTQPKNKARPDNVPQENVYDSLHWLIIVTYILAAASVAILIIFAS